MLADHTLPPPMVVRSYCEEMQFEVNTPGFLFSTPVFCLFFVVFPHLKWSFLFKYRAHRTMFTSVFTKFRQSSSASRQNVSRLVFLNITITITRLQQLYIQNHIALKLPFRLFSNSNLSPMFFLPHLNSSWAQTQRLIIKLNTSPLAEELSFRIQSSCPFDLIQQCEIKGEWTEINIFF